MNLRYDMRKADDAGYAVTHPQTVMRKFGITYRYAEPVPIADQWWFFDCAGVPEPLPPFLSVLPREVQPS